MNTEEKLLSYLNYAAYIPCYENGNSVMAIKKDGRTTEINKSVKSLIRNILKESSLDIYSLRKNFSGSIGRSNLIPIPLSLDIILIPVKVRKTIAVNNGSYAYIDLCQVEKVYGEQSAVIRLLCGYEINSMEALRTVKKKISLGNVVREKFASSVPGKYRLMEGISVAGLEYSRPATKGDITMLAYELIKLRKTLEK